MRRLRDRAQTPRDAAEIAEMRFTIEASQQRAIVLDLLIATS